MSLLPAFVQPLYRPSPDALLWVESLGTVMADDVFANTWTVERGSSRRVVFIFDDYFAVTWCGDDEEGFSDLIQVWYLDRGWVDEETGMPNRPCPIILSEEVPWDKETKTWKTAPNNYEEILAFLDAGFRASLNKDVTIAFPWEGFFNDEETTMVEELLPDYEGTSLIDVAAQVPDEKVVGLQESFKDMYGDYSSGTIAPYVFAALATEYPFVYPTHWGENIKVALGEGDSWLPPYSPLSDFYRLLNDLSELPNFFIIWDECCAACAHGTRESILSSGQYGEDAEDVVLWGQNSQYRYFADGTISESLYLNNLQAVALLEKYNIPGLSVG